METVTTKIERESCDDAKRFYCYHIEIKVLQCANYSTNLVHKTFVQHKKGNHGYFNVIFSDGTSVNDEVVPMFFQNSRIKF